ncbi:MAG: hypothetical protein JXA90_13750 [Planctomycetes bacterium]|nr:hypothetical protein [Planctomycetota bacterium]
MVRLSQPIPLRAAASCILLAVGVLAARGLRAQQQIVLVEEGDEWSYFKGTREPSPESGTNVPTTLWTETGFDDSGWLSGPSGFGYGDGDDATALSDMQDIYMSVYIRRTFTVASLAAIERLSLTVDVDDGFVAYLNGQEIARYHVTGTPPPFDAAATDHEAGTPMTYEVNRALLNAGENILALQGHNASLSSSDFSLIPRLVANPDFCPVAENLTCEYDAATGAVVLSWLNEVVYDEIDIYRGGELLAENLAGGTSVYTDTSAPAGMESTYSIAAVSQGMACAELECSVFVPDPEDILLREGDEWKFFRGSSAPPAGWETAAFDDGAWESGPVAIGYGTITDAGVSVRTTLSDMQQDTSLDPPVAGYLAVFCRRAFDLTEAGASAQLTLSILYDDGLVVYLNGVEVGRANMPAGAVTSTTAASGAAPEPSTAEFLLPSDALVVGRNVLAASVHNNSLTSSDLMFLPSLVREPQDPGGLLFHRGDATDDGLVNLSDAVRVLGHLFQAWPAPPCVDAGDTDDNGLLNLTDAVYLLNHLFLAGPELPLPGMSACGPDPTPDGLGDCSTTACAP